MSHGTGRHRRRRQGWASRMRWAVGAVLAAVVGAGPAPPARPAPLKGRMASPRREPSNPATSSPHPEPAWVQGYDRARRTHTDRAWALFTEGSEEAAHDAPAGLPELGWCVDDDGVRAVRPYLVAHEQRQRAMRQRGARRDSHQREPVPRVPVQTAALGASGEWDELAGLVRQWNAQRVPVA
jgi:hypothetical protein